MDKIYRIYKYVSPSNKVYIGQTCNSLKIRAKNGEGYKECPKFYMAIKKYGWKNFSSQILIDNLNKEQADYWEKFYISLYKSTDDNYGYNLSEGGTKNKKLSNESRKKMSSSQLGRKHSLKTKQKMSNSHKGKKLTEEHKKNISLANMGRCSPMKNKKHKEETIEKMKNNKKKSKPVICIETGIIYPSAAEAARQLGMKSGSHINDCINYPNRYKTSGGYHWKRMEI